jgi:hypothetical protein
MKLLKLLLIAGMALSLNAAKLEGPDENGRLYDTAYFDVKADAQSPVLDLIGYSKRTGTFDWSKIYTQLKTFNADIVEYKIKTRVEIPAEITTDSIYVTVGDNFYFNVSSGGNWSEAEILTKTVETKSSGRTAVINFTTTVNDEKLTSGNAILAKTKKDNFGSKYIDLEMTFKIDDSGEKLASHKTYMATVVAKNLGPKFDTIKIKVAPKSRSFQSQWVEPKIYVMND